MTRISAPPDIGVPVKHRPGQWVQTERKAHEAWARLGIKKPTAAAVLHHLVAQMGHQNAVVVSQKVLAAMLGVDVRTIQRAIRDLVAERWIQVVRLGKGKEAAYVINDQVAWGQPRDQLRLSTFSATIIADADDQDAETLEHCDLRRIPTLYAGERQLPAGPGEDPPSQPSIDGLEPDLPAIIAPKYSIDEATGEIIGLPKAGEEWPDPWAGQRRTDEAERAELESQGQMRLAE